MTGLVIAVLTDDENYGRALARGLAEESERVIVKVVCTKGMADDEFLSEAEKLSDEGSILLTDRRTAAAISGHAVLISKEEPQADENCIFKLSPVDRILGKIKEVYSEIGGSEFLRLEAEEETIIGIFSQTGGCGCTSISVTLSRWLALTSEKPVLYINAGIKDDYRYYFPGKDEKAEMEKIRSKKELIFHMTEKLAWSFERYCFKDGYGVFALRPEHVGNCLSAREHLERFLASVTERKYFRYIIIDGMIDRGNIVCDLKIAVFNAEDKRSGFFDDEGCLVSVYNFAENGADKAVTMAEEDEAAESAAEKLLYDEGRGVKKGRRFYIPSDEKSFKASETGVEISMEGIFSACVRELLIKIHAESKFAEDYAIEAT